MTSASLSEIPQTIPSELRIFIEKTFTDIDEVKLTAVVSKLQDLGVDCVEDLKFLQESDLKDILKPVQIRKFLHHVQQPVKACNLDNPSCSSPKRDVSAKVVTSPESLFKLFNLETVLQSMPAVVKESLDNGNRLPTDIRRVFVRELVDSVRKCSQHTRKKDFEEIARSIVNRYPNSLEDRIDKIRIGSGYDSLLKQLISRNENLNRPYNHTSLVGNISDKTTHSDNGGAKCCRKKLKQDSYGCINWGPSLSPEEEESQEKIRKEMVDCHGAQVTDWPLIYSSMEAAYPLLRKHINHEHFSVCQMLEDWPYFIEKNVMLSHVQQLLGIDIAKAAENFFLKKGVRMIRFFRSRIPEVRPYIIAAEEEKEGDNLAAILPLVILCLQTSLGEKEDSLFAVVDEMSSNEELKSAGLEKSWPRLVMLGKSVLAASKSVLVVDGQVVGRFSSFLDAVALLFGAYYIFNIQYPKEACGTLEFIQRCCMGINPGSGVKSTKKKKTSDVNHKVLKLINELADFEWTDETS